MEEENEDVTEIMSLFSKSEQADSIDLSSCDLYGLPLELFKLDLSRMRTLSLDHNNIERLPNDMNLLQNLSKLSIVGNELTLLPDSVSKLHQLCSLDLNENSVSELPESFGELKLLLHLTMIGNNLTSLPESFTMLGSLEELFLDENRITCLPTGWMNMKNLHTFEISSNGLLMLPDDIGGLEKLQIFSCNDNCLKELPYSFSALKELHTLDLSNNKLDSLPETFDSAKVIQRLFLENNNFKTVPQWFTELHELKELTIADNALSLEQFTDDFCCHAQKLKKLEAGGNFMTSLSLQIGKLKSLEIIHLGSTICELERSNFQNGNWIKHLPDSFCELSNLRKANLNENQIDKLPQDFGNLQLLNWLDLGQNMLGFLPDSFCRLVHLEFLQLSKNQLKTLPENIGDLQNLIDFRLDNNLLTVVPESVGRITKLQSFDLFHNQLTEIPSVVYNLKNLKRLDLDQNLFSLKLAEVPKITPGNNYPDRDPNLKDNWRGRTRPDKIKSNNVIDVEIDPECNDDGGGDNGEEVQWNEHALRRAMSRGMSMWRSHNGTETREVQQRITQPVQEPKQNVDDDVWEPIMYSVHGSHSYQPGFSSSRQKPEPERDPCEEDWDAEIVEDQQYTSVVESCLERKFKKSTVIDDFQNTINRYPPAQQAYSNTAGYDSFVYKSTQNDATFVTGQFDDAD